MGLACSADQSMPLNTGVSPCQRHRMNPQRDCRACQEFMKSRRPEPRGNQFAPRVQQRFPLPRQLNQNRVGPMGLSPQIPRGPSPIIMGNSSPMMSPPMESRPQGMSSAIPLTQPQVIQGSALHIPQQVMPPRMISQEVRTPNVVQASAQPLCSTNIVLPPTQFKEIVQMPMPEVITAPALPPCPTNMLVQKVRSSPQRPEIRTFPQQTTHSRLQPQHQQPRFL